MKVKIILGLFLLVGATATGFLWIWNYQHAKVARLVAGPLAEAARNETRAAVPPATLPPKRARTRRSSRPAAASPQSQRSAQPAPAATPTPRQEPLIVASSAPALVITEPLAREALSYVGDDPNAEAVWIAAINDPNLSNAARSNLIEDLNENGFPDPSHPTADDLSLIVSRIQLIEALAPDAMDDVNAAAFAEAYKDLVNMFSDVTGS
jgi:hypothetical protein